MKQQLDTLRKLLSFPKKIAIVIHRNPDGDAIGSGVALQEFLMNNKHQTTIISPNEVPDYLKWMPNINKILIFEQNQKKAENILNESDIIFTLDFNDFSRTGKEFEKSLYKQNGKTFVMIDHHLEPSNYAIYTFSEPHKSSTSEMVYEFIVQLSDKSAISKDMAIALYTGIMTDTGSFKFPNTSSNTMRIVSELMNKDIAHNKIQIKIYDSFTTDKLHLLGEALNKLVFLPKYKTAYIALTKAELDKYNYKKGDTEGFVNYGLTLADSNFAAMFIENDNEGVRISFRSKGNFPANEFAKKYFNGGGHLNAAGGRTQLSLEDAVSLFKDKLPEFKDKLLATHV